MKADYKNWMPKGMVLGTIGITAAIFFVAVIVGMASIVGKVLLILTVLFALISLWMYLMYRAFSYNGTRQMSKQISFSRGVA